MATEDDELEAIRRRKLQEIQQEMLMQAEAKAIEEERARYEAQKHAILRQILTSEARERLGRLRTVRPELVAMVEEQLIALAQTGRLNRVIDDDELKQLLARLSPKKEFKIEFR